MAKTRIKQPAIEAAQDKAEVTAFIRKIGDLQREVKRLETERDSFYINAQVENANRKLETAFLVCEKVKEGEKEAMRARKKAFIYYCFGVVWFFLALILFLLW